MSEEPFSVLAVCPGNVCRSPAVERLLICKLSSTVAVNSAGTHTLIGHPISDPMAVLPQDSGLDPDSFEGRRLSEHITHAQGGRPRPAADPRIAAAPG
jgi:protein-tyrosine phosphatase